MKKKLCVVYNFAAHYRARIFQLIDETYDCDWFFGKKNDDITKMDLSSLKGCVKEVDEWTWHGVDYQKGVVGLLFKSYDTYLVFAQTKTLSTWIFLFLSKLCPKKRVFLWSHGFYGKESMLERIIKRWMFKIPNGGTFLYNNHARELMIKEGINPNKLFVIHNSLDYEHQVAVRKTLKPSPLYVNHFGNNYQTIVFIGRLTKVKKLDLLIDIVYIMNKQAHPVNLVFVGDGVERQRLEKKVEELNVKGAVWFYGACFDELKNAELVYNADVCVAPGNVGLTAMHTMVYGTPVITHNDFSRQMPEFEAIIDGVTGSFFERDNLDSMICVIKQWLENKKDGREAVREACYKEIDTNWTPAFQIEVLKSVITPQT